MTKENPKSTEQSKRVCKHCGKPISGHWRRDYCNDACKQAAYRKRQALETATQAA